MPHVSKHQEGREKCEFQDRSSNREEYLKTVSGAIQINPQKFLVDKVCQEAKGSVRMSRKFIRISYRMR